MSLHAALTRASTCSRLDHPACPDNATQTPFKTRLTHTPHGLCSPHATWGDWPSGGKTPQKKGLSFDCRHRFQRTVSLLPGVLFYLSHGVPASLSVRHRNIPGLPIQVDSHRVPRDPCYETRSRTMRSGTPHPLVARYSTRFPDRFSVTAGRSVGAGARDPYPARNPDGYHTRKVWAIIRFRSPLPRNILFLQVLMFLTCVPRPKPVPTHDGRVPPFGNLGSKPCWRLP